MYDVHCTYHITVCTAGTMNTVQNLRKQVACCLNLKRKKNSTTVFEIARLDDGGGNRSRQRDTRTKKKEVGAD